MTTHDPIRAADDANAFLKAMYVENNYSKALQLADAQLRVSLGTDELRTMAIVITEERGKLKTLQADSYLPTGGATLEVFYVGSYDEGSLYHRLALIGDGINGYKVTGIWFSFAPYPNSQLRRKFGNRILVA